MKQLIGKDPLLEYPNLSKEFVIHKDASKTQLGAVISQEKWPIGFYSCKLMPEQTRYTTNECGLLSIVEILKEFKNIFLDQRISIYTNNKILTH